LGFDQGVGVGDSQNASMQLNILEVG
jgi:hypothetical protein